MDKSTQGIFSIPFFSKKEVNEIIEQLSKIEIVSPVISSVKTKSLFTERLKYLNRDTINKKPTPNAKELNKASIDKILQREKKRDYFRACRNATKVSKLHNNTENIKKAKCTEHFQSNEHFVIDHKVSIYFGFKNGISVEDICHPSNLRWISGKINSMKSAKVFFDCHNMYLIKKYNLSIIESKIFNEIA